MARRRTSRSIRLPAPSPVPFSSSATTTPRRNPAETSSAQTGLPRLHRQTNSGDATGTVFRTHRVLAHRREAVFEAFARPELLYRDSPRFEAALRAHDYAGCR